MEKQNNRLKIERLEDFKFGVAPHPVQCGHGVEIGVGDVIPEINFTLPTMNIETETMSTVRNHYSEIISSICKRAVALEVPAFLVEFETLPPMTVNPEWGLELTRILSGTLREYSEKAGVKAALRLTPNDTREHLRPPLMRRGEYWDGMVGMFDGAAGAGADMLAIESTGGKEVCDEGLMMADLKSLVFALGVLAPRDMEFLWKHIVSVCERDGILPSGDTACGFANTAMVLADRGFIPKLFAAVVRVATVPRSLVAYQVGAKGPSKDCAYEGPYMKAIAGIPISMEGRTAACAHFSQVGNIAQAVCDCWSNESVQNVQLLSGKAPEVSFEQLAYDCRLLNRATAHSEGAAILMRDLLVDSDSGMDPQAYVLRPDVVLELSAKIIQQATPYQQVRTAVEQTLSLLEEACDQGKVRIPEREKRWFNVMQMQFEELPENEDAFIEEMLNSDIRSKFIPGEYGIDA